MKRVYVIDDLLLFNPNLSGDKEIYYYNEESYMGSDS